MYMYTHINNTSPFFLIVYSLREDGQTCVLTVFFVLIILEYIVFIIFKELNNDILFYFPSVTLSYFFSFSGFVYCVLGSSKKWRIVKVLILSHFVLQELINI